jgi:hypothetical protein
VQAWVPRLLGPRGVPDTHAAVTTPQAGRHILLVPPSTLAMGLSAQVALAAVQASLAQQGWPALPQRVHVSPRQMASDAAHLLLVQCITRSRPRPKVVLGAGRSHGSSWQGALGAVCQCALVRCGFGLCSG